jgi:hypothetical protein
MIRTIDNNRFTLLLVMVYRYHKIKKRGYCAASPSPIHLEQARFTVYLCLSPLDFDPDFDITIHMDVEIHPVPTTDLPNIPCFQVMTTLKTCI